MATQQQLEDGLRKAHAAGNKEHAQAFARALTAMRSTPSGAPTAEEAPAEAPDTRPTSQASGFAQTFTRPARNLYHWMGGNTDNYDRRVAGWNKQTKPGGIGSFAGSALAAFPILAATRNPWLASGATGALESEKDTVRGVAGDAAMGAVLGKAGDSAVRAAGAVVKPIWRDNVNKLLGEGVRLTPGQIVGGTAKAAEDVASNIVGIGDVVRGAQKRAEGDFVTAATNRALSPSGRKLALGVKPGHEGIKVAQKELGQQYDNILSTATLNVGMPRVANTPTGMAQRRNSLQFLVGLRNLGRLTGSLPTQHQQHFNRVMTEEVGRRFGGSGRMSGQSFKELDEVLGKEIKTYSSGLPDDRKYADAIRTLQYELRQALGRSNPAHRKALQATDEGYSNLAKVELAAGNARAGSGGRFTPDELHTAARQQDTTVRHRRMAAGDARMQELSEAGGDVLHRTIGEGAGTRATVNAMLAAALYGGGSNLAFHPLGMAALAGLTGAYTKRGGAIVRGAMTKRPKGAAAVRRVLQKGARAAPAIVNPGRISEEED